MGDGVERKEKEKCGVQPLAGAPQTGLQHGNDRGAVVHVSVSRFAKIPREKDAQFAWLPIHDNRMWDGTSFKVQFLPLGKAKSPAHPAHTDVDHRGVGGRDKRLEQHPIEEQHPKTVPSNFTHRAQQHQDGGGVHELGGDGGQVVAQPQVLAVGEVFPEVEDADIDELRQEVGRHACPDGQGGLAKDMVKFGA